MAENEARFRSANDAIVATARELEVETLVPFVCECSDAACTEIVRMSVGEYLDVRADPRHFFVRLEHADVAQRAGVALRRHDRYVVIRKTGTAGEVAERLEQDPPR